MPDRGSPPPKALHRRRLSLLSIYLPSSIRDVQEENVNLPRPPADSGTAKTSVHRKYFKAARPRTELNEQRSRIFKSPRSIYLDDNIG